MPRGASQVGTRVRHDHVIHQLSAIGPSSRRECRASNSNSRVPAGSTPSCLGTTQISDARLVVGPRKIDLDPHASQFGLALDDAVSARLAVPLHARVDVPAWSCRDSYSTPNPSRRRRCRAQRLAASEWAVCRDCPAWRCASPRPGRWHPARPHRSTDGLGRGDREAGARSIPVVSGVTGAR